MEDLPARPAVAGTTPANAGRPALPAPPAGLATGLYILWAGIAWGAHVSGLAVLQTGTGWILALGAALTVALFHNLVMLPAGEQPGRGAGCIAQSLMGLIWAALYGHFAAGGTLLAGGMSLSAVLLALPAGQRRVLRFLMGGSLCTLAGVQSLPLLAGDFAVARLVDMLVLGGALAVVYIAVDAFAGWLDEWRREGDERLRDMQVALTRLVRRMERDQQSNAWNRHQILDAVAREKARAERGGEAFCVLLLDIDHFHALNDQLGPEGGERILATFARRVRSVLRGVDLVNANQIPGALGRLGGEEFIIIAPATTLGGALRCAERIRQAVVRRPFSGLHQVTVSIGIAEYHAGESVTELIARADKALYSARSAGRNRVHCATADGARSKVIMPEFPAAS